MGFFKGLKDAFMDGFNSNNNKQKTTSSRNNSVDEVDLEITTTFTSYNVVPKIITAKKVYNFKNDDLFHIKRNFCSIRHDKKITQKQISEFMGFKSTSFISRFENGEVEQITHEQLEQLAAGLDVDISELLTGYEKI